MKKLFATVSLVFIVIFSFFTLTACSSGPEQLFIEPIWNNSENFVYSVKNKNLAVGEVGYAGTYTYKIEKINGPTTIGQESLTAVVGSKVVSNLVMDNGDAVLSEVFFNTNFVPTHSYRMSLINGVTNTLNAKYAGKQFTYTYNEQPLSKIKVKGIFYDNEMLIAVLRGSRIENDKYAGLNFAVPSLTDKKLVKFNSTKLSKIKINVPFKQDANSYLLNTKIAKKNSGQPIAYYYSVDDISANNKVYKKVPLQIIEGQMEYQLTGISE